MLCGNLEVDTQAGISFYQDQTIEQKASWAGKASSCRTHFFYTFDQNDLDISLHKFALLCCSNSSEIWPSQRVFFTLSERALQATENAVFLRLIFLI